MFSIDSKKVKKINIFCIVCDKYRKVKNPKYHIFKKKH